MPMTTPTGFNPTQILRENPILTLGDTLWFGPAITWPKVLSNHPYIHFWHRLDRALLDAQIPEMGTEVLGESDWAALFPSGPLNEGEDPEIIMTVKTVAASGFPLLEVDQRGTERPVNELGDIGAIEVTGASHSTHPRPTSVRQRDEQERREGQQGPAQAKRTVHDGLPEGEAHPADDF